MRNTNIIHVDTIVSSALLSPSSSSSSYSSASSLASSCSDHHDKRTDPGTNDEGVVRTISSPTALVHNETKWLSKARILMMFVLVVGMTASATVTFIFTTRLEESDFNIRVRKAQAFLFVCSIFCGLTHLKLFTCHCRFTLYIISLSFPRLS
jgi:hypothetical protein